MRGSRSRAAAAAVLTCLVGGCAPSAPPDAPSAVRGAVDTCGGLAAEAKQDCYEARLLEELDRAGVAPALDMLAAVAAADADVERDGHVYTHAIGITAYDPDRPVGEVFSQCNITFQSGCYHGVIQAHFMAQGIPDAESVRALCEPYKGPGGDRWLLFQCLHGLGHGLTMFYGHNLPRALEDCDLLSDSWDSESCYGGAFMENVVNATSPHHPATEMASDDEDATPPGGARGEAGAHGEHDHGAMASEELEPWEALRPDEPHYPCSALDDRYQRACYMMQTSVMLTHNGGDVGEAAEECGRAPEPWRATCFQSLGRDVSSRTLQEPRASLRECRKAPEEYREWCYVGLVKNFVDLTATTEAGFDFCRRVEDFAKPRCNEAMGEEIGVLHASLDERRDACQAAETFELVSYCLRGARVAGG